MSKVLEVRNLQTHFTSKNGLVKAVDGLSFTLNAGETLGIVGESGSGKSVTSLSIMGLLPQPVGKIVAGEVFYHQGDTVTDLAQLSNKEMRLFRGKEIAMIFQEPMSSLNPVMRCGHQVAEAILIHQNISRKEAKEKVLALFGQVKLPDPDRMYKAYPHQLSGGQKQRVMIAMAMSNSPRVLIADEPTTALDVTVQKRILELMNELKAETQTATIFITHDLGVVAEIADKVVVMYKGKAVEVGTVKDIFTNPQHPYTKSLLACRPPLAHRMSRLPVVDDFMNNESKLIDALIASWKVETKTTEQRLAQLQAKKPLLEVQDLSVWFPKTKNWFGKPTAYVKAVDEVSFELYPGETLGLVGESGCGKTTLGRAILNLMPARSGKVIYKGESVLDLDAKRMKALRKEMQIIFQDPFASLNPRMSIGDAIQEPMQVHGIVQGKQALREKTIALLETVGLEADHFNRYPHEFSGGQRQRVGIARALAVEPKFLVCDESVSALDVSVQAQVLNLLMELREQMALTYIFISHDLSVVKFISDRMMVMNQGKIEEIGAADDIYNHPKSPYTQQLIEAIPLVEY